MSGHPAGAAEGPSPQRLYSLISAMVLFWALNFLIGKIALREFPPLLLAGLRTSLAGVLILPLFFWQRRVAPEKTSWKREELPLLLFLGLAGVALNQLFFIAGLSRTSVAHSAILLGMTPILVLVLSAAGGQERISPGRAAGMLLALAGVAVLNSAPTRSGGATLAGDLLTLAGAFTFAVLTVAGKRATASHGAVMVNTFAYVGGGLALSPLTLWEASRLSLAAISLKAWACLLYMALFPSLVCYLIFYYVLTHLPASRVSAFSYLQPLIATTAGALILKEQITATLISGGALVFAGVFITERA